MPEGYEALDCKCQMIVDEYDEDLGLFQQLSHVVVSAINDSLAANNMHVTAVEARIKQRDSLIGKLMRKGHLYGWQTCGLRTVKMPFMNGGYML